MLPTVVTELKRNGFLKPWMEFNRLVNDRKFPFENIAFQLFMDVCRFYSCENTCELKYSKTVKRFWRIGFKLFHGKFLRFMGGPKHTGSVLSSNSDRGTYDPAEGKINFSVPRRSVQSQSFCPISGKDIQPGILDFLLSRVADCSDSQKTYKLCLDGKKINSSTSGKCGDIDLWGYEHRPTLNQRREQLNTDQSVIDDLYTVVQRYTEKGNTLYSLSKEEKQVLISKLMCIVNSLSGRLKTLREMIITKETSRDKLKSQAGQEWEKSHLAFVISSLITTVYDLKSCVSNVLKVIDQTCRVIATLNGMGYATVNVVNLSESRTYQHLTGNSTDPRYIKQRTNEWKEIRNKALVTGSTLYDALGLRTLKMQTAHFDAVVSDIPKPEPADNVKRMMDHGSENEIHAVATVATKVLPVLKPNLKIFEEGCYPLNFKVVPAVISPDGSCKESQNSHPEYGIEIKCPFPGNKFSTPVQYKLPKYYVPQVLAEMKALNTDKLYFVSYSEESTAVHEVRYDAPLWELLEQEVISIYGAKKQVRPTRKSSMVPIIQDKINSFITDNVSFIMELPSVKGVQCSNIQETNVESAELYCNKHRGKNTETLGNVSMDQLGEILYNAGINLKRAYQLTRNKASELLAFMISDLDRNYNPESLHSVPIAYGLKGYSLPSDVLRTMMDDVLIECSKQGLYVPVCSFDGQWCRLVVRDKESNPLTVLQLQKDVFNDAKKLTKSEIIKKISECNIVSVKSFEQLQSVTSVKKLTRLKSNLLRESFIDVKRMENRKVYFISKNTFDIIRRNENIENEIDDEERKVEENILNNIDDVVLDEVSNEIAEKIDAITNDSTKIKSKTLKLVCLMKWTQTPSLRKTVQQRNL